MVVFSGTVSSLATMMGNTEFYSSVHRANVALSRAKRQLIVVCSAGLLGFLPQEEEQYNQMQVRRGRGRTHTCRM